MISTIQNIVFIKHTFIKVKSVKNIQPILDNIEKRNGLSEDAYVLEKINNRDQHKLNILV